MADEHDELSERVKKRDAKKVSFFVYGRENAKLRRAIAESGLEKNPYVVRSRAIEDLVMLEREHTGSCDRHSGIL